MKRTNIPLQYNVNEEPIVLSKPLIDCLLKDKNRFSDMLALYTFYYYTAKWQKTTQPHATVAYVSKGIGWGTEKVQLIRAKLLDIGLIEDIVQRGEDGRLLGHYVRVNFICTPQQNVDTPTLTTHGILPGEVKSISNALNPNNINASSSNTENPLPQEDHITPKIFDRFWKIYPKKADKGKALTAWNKLCRKPAKERPTWHQVKCAIIHQMKTPRWSTPKFIPHPSTWINQCRWLDDPAEMQNYIDDKPKWLRDMKPFILDPEQGKFVLRDDGQYYHCRSGERYIP